MEETLNGFKNRSVIAIMRKLQTINEQFYVQFYEDLPEESTIFMYKQLNLVTGWFDELVDALKVSLTIGIVSGAVLTLLALVLQFYDFRRRTMELRRGLKDDFTNVEIAHSAAFVGISISSTIVGFFIITFMVMFIVLPFAWPLLVNFIWAMREDFANKGKKWPKSKYLVILMLLRFPHLKQWRKFAIDCRKAQEEEEEAAKQKAKEKTKGGNNEPSASKVGASTDSEPEDSCTAKVKPFQDCARSVLLDEEIVQLKDRFLQLKERLNKATALQKELASFPEGSKEAAAVLKKVNVVTGRKHEFAVVSLHPPRLMEGWS
mmetsp:Transcript_95415/g.309204  ORF Transcript_95415/g.309204 Transcript_95415/m.309204 type:complete len:319 (+) Transcript_95415:547-1503(+)